MATNAAKAAYQKKDTHHIGADIPMALYQALRARAERDMVSQADVIRWAIADALTSDMNENGDGS